MKKIIILCAFLLLVSGCGNKTVDKITTYTANDGMERKFRCSIPESWTYSDDDNSTTFLLNSTDELNIVYLGGDSSFDNMKDQFASLGNNPAIKIEYQVLDDEIDDDNSIRLLKYTRIETDGNLYQYGYIVDFLWNGMMSISTSKLKTATNPYEKEMTDLIDSLKAI